MAGSGRRAAAVLAPVLLGLAAAPLQPPAQALTAPTVPAVVAGPGSADAASYATPLVTVRPGDGLSLVNTDISWHALVSVELGADDQPWCGPLDPSRPEGPANPRRYPLGQCPLFLADPAPGLGGVSPVVGLGAVVANRVYPFRCSIVPGMAGNLIVAPQST
jgi:hypothetical protein